MIIKRKIPDGSSYNFDSKKTTDMLKMITIFFQKQDTLTNEEYYKILSNFYDFELEDKDYLDIVNIITKDNYNNIVNIKTNQIYSDLEREGHGRDFSFWTVKYRLFIKAAIKDSVIEDNKEYTVEELKELISETKIFPIIRYGIKCDDELKVNINNDVWDLETLANWNYRKVDAKTNYFNIIIELIKRKLSINKVYKDIKSYLLEFNNYIREFDEYKDEYYAYIDEEFREISNRRIIAIEKSLYYYDKYFKHKHKLEKSELYQKQLIKK